ncbi:MAG: ABC transporter substrate-binding protein [Pseudomonadota bacterium]
MVAVATVALGSPAVAAKADDGAPPQSVVSMNLCTDQLAMLLAAPGQLISVSYLAHKADTSTMAGAAAAYPANHGRAEEIFLLEPDLVVGGVYTSQATVAMLRRLGYAVETFEPAYSFAAVRANIRRMGALLGRADQAEALVAAFDAELASVEAGERAPPRLALYYANSYTSGVGTLADEVVGAAGFANIARELGFEGTLKLPLESLVMAAPDVVVGKDAGRAAAGRAHEHYAHPALRRATDGALMASVADKYWICGGPFTAEAVRLLADERAAEPHSPSSTSEPAPAQSELRKARPK